MTSTPNVVSPATVDDVLKIQNKNLVLLFTRIINIQLGNSDLSRKYTEEEINSLIDIIMTYVEHEKKSCLGPWTRTR